MKINTGCWVNGCKCFNPNDEDGVEIKRDKEWVGLTDAEKKAIYQEATNEDWTDLDVINATEAKLKEKNT